jgi:hypothetical protein
MAGKWVRGGERPKPQPGVILQLRPYELHGTPYVAVLYRLDADPEAAAREARLSFEMIYADPHPGDRVLVESVLNVVDRMMRAPDS